jgi:hypothetical protein
MFWASDEFAQQGASTIHGVVAPSDRPEHSFVSVKWVNACKTGIIMIWVNLNTNLLISTDKHGFIPHEDEDADLG